METSDYIFKYYSKSRNKIYDIDLYDIVDCRPYRTYDHIYEKWVPTHVELNLDGDYPFTRIILSPKMYRDFLDVARKNMDSFGRFFGMLPEEYLNKF